MVNATLQKYFECSVYIFLQLLQVCISQVSDMVIGFSAML